LSTLEAIIFGLSKTTNPKHKKRSSNCLLRRNARLCWFARLETEVWQTLIFPNSSGILFPKGRIAFCHPDGTPAEGSLGALSVFVAFGKRTAKTLLRMAKRGVIAGAYLDRPLFTTYRGGQ
jgi:hypothetical protein